LSIFSVSAAIFFIGGDSYGGVIFVFWFLFFFFLSGAYSTILGLIYILPSSINIKKNNIRKKSEKKEFYSEIL
jgi:hypothetical protein